MLGHAIRSRTQSGRSFRDLPVTKGLVFRGKYIYSSPTRDKYDWCPIDVWLELFRGAFQMSLDARDVRILRSIAENDSTSPERIQEETNILNRRSITASRI